MANAQLPSELEAVLDTTGTLLARLYQVLEDEHAALRDNAMSALEAAIAEKQQLCERIDAEENRRSQLAVEAGFTADTTGMAGLIGKLEQQFGPVPGIVQRWQALQQLLHKCERQNHINGLLLERNRHRAQSLLTLLQGGGQGQELYDPRGATVRLRNRASLARA